MHKRHDTHRDKTRKPEAKGAALARRAARHAKTFRLFICLAPDGARLGY